MHYLFLAIAILGEICGTLALKASNSFTQFWPTAIVVASYLLSFYFLSLTMDKIPVGITYAVWSAVGMVVVPIGGYYLYQQTLDLPAMIGMVLIIVGVIVITGLSKSQVH